MAKEDTCRTYHVWFDGAGNERECEVEITYTVTPGYPQTWEEPGQPHEVEVHSVRPIGTCGNVLEATDSLAQFCLEDWHAKREEAHAAGYLRLHRH